MTLTTISKILVPIDGSPSSTRAADAAVELAKRYGEESHPVEVIALHVIDINPKFHLFSKYGFHYSEYEKAAVEEAGKITEGWFSKIREKAESCNVRFRSEVSDNSTLSVIGEIVDYAEREHVDAIVIGTKGHSEFKKLMMGSVSSGVATYAPCTVIIVR
ncbi:MAG TPA: universal stress protein [Nitrososphaera sp.]|nr:universal stress protein [Nitrososphaera sp.]